MKMKCEIIQDLFPSYIDGLTSQESNEVIEEHLEECRKCREYLDEMKEDIAGENQPAVNKKAVKPFKRLRQKTRRKILLAAGAAVLACALVFGGGFFYYARSWTADSADVKMTVEAQGGIATLRFAPEEENRQLYAEPGEDNTITIKEKKLPPFMKASNPNAYWSCTFIGESTSLGADGKEVEFSQDQKLTIQYKDQKETISISDLAKQALENPPARSEEVKMTWDKDEEGRVTLGFFPEILGVSLKVEETGENQILIRQYWDGEGEEIDNGDFYTLHFLDENIIQREDGTVLEFSEDQSLIIEYKDKTQEILFSDIWKGNLPEQ